MTNEKVNATKCSAIAVVVDGEEGYINYHGLANLAEI
jgi:hypothetical protein